MSATEYRATMREYLVHLVWEQWSRLGVAAHAAADAEQGDTLDPEALILLTSEIGRYEPRLFDLMLDWLIAYSRLVNVQRLVTLCRKYKWVDASLLGYIASVCVRHGGDPRWQKLVVEKHTEPQPLFLDIETQRALFVARSDTSALQHGWIRSEYTRSGKVAPHLPQRAETLLLMLRGCVGVNARAEILLLLLSGVGKPTELASRSTFAPSTVHEILREMQLSGMIDDVADDARGHHYIIRVITIPQIRDIVSSVKFPCWIRIIDFMGQLWNLLTNAKVATLSDKTFLGELDHLVRRSLLPVSRTADFPPSLLRLLSKPTG